MIFFTDSTSLYIYSAFLQANAAIFAVFGVFIVYSMQSHKSSIDIIKSTMYSDRGEHSQPTTIAEFESLSTAEKKQKFSVMDTKGYYYKLYETWIHHLDRNNELKKYITLPTIILTIGMILDALFLLFCSNFHYYHPNSEVIIAMILVVYHIVIWSFIAKDLIKVIKND